MWVVVKIMVPFWVLIIIQHLIFRHPQRDRNFDNHPCLKTCEDPRLQVPNPKAVSLKVTHEKYMPC